MSFNKLPAEQGIKNPGTEEQDVNPPMLPASRPLPVHKTWGENMGWKSFLVLIFCAAITVPARPQSATESQTQSSVCTLADSNQMTVRFTPLPANARIDMGKGKIWSPGDTPMYLFSEAASSLGGSDVPVGAYSMYLIPNGRKWTLIVNKDVTAGDKYDEKQDVARAEMSSEQLLDSQAFSIVFVRPAPKQCSLQILYGKLALSADFNEK